METGDPANSNDAPQGQGERWVQFCDDFITLEGQCALLCELLVGTSRRETPMDSAAQHGVELFVGQLRHQLQLVKQQVYAMRPD